MFSKSIPADIISLMQVCVVCVGRCVGSGWVQVCVWVCTRVGAGGGGGLDVFELYGDTVMSVYGDTVMSVYLCPRLRT